MSLPPPLIEHVQGARRTIERAHWIDGERVAKNAQAFLAEAEWRIMPTPASDKAFAEASARIREFPEKIGHRGGLRSQNAAENARALALIALERLEEVLVEARPSDLARGVGEDS